MLLCSEIGRIGADTRPDSVWLSPLAAIFSVAAVFSFFSLRSAPIIAFSQILKVWHLRHEHRPLQDRCHPFPARRPPTASDHTAAPRPHFLPSFFLCRKLEVEVSASGRPLHHPIPHPHLPQYDLLRCLLFSRCASRLISPSPNVSLCSL